MRERLSRPGLDPWHELIEIPLPHFVDSDTV